MCIEKKLAMPNILKVKQKSLLYFLTIICVALLSVLGSLNHQNIKYKEQNRALLLENDSILSVNQKLHQRLEVEHK